MNPIPSASRPSRILPVSTRIRARLRFGLEWDRDTRPGGKDEGFPKAGLFLQPTVGICDLRDKGNYLARGELLFLLFSCADDVRLIVELVGSRQGRYGGVKS